MFARKFNNSLLVAILGLVGSLTTVSLTTSALTSVGIRTLYPFIWSSIAAIIYYVEFRWQKTAFRSLASGLIVGLFCGAIGIGFNYFLTDMFFGIHDRSVSNYIVHFPNYVISSMLMGVPFVSSLAFFVGYKIKILSA